MDEDFIPAQERLLALVRKLREVFDVCDDDSDGFIRREHLVQLGSQFGQTEQVRTCVLTFSHCSVLHLFLARFS